MEKETITVVGAGLMGHAIAQEFAASGHPVLLCDLSSAVLDAAMENIEHNMHLLVSFGLMERQAIAPNLKSITTTTDLQAAAAESDLVIEAVSEDLEVKRSVFEKLDSAAPANTILASNTSSFLPDTLAKLTKRPDKVIIAHYFNPPYLIPLVEVVRGRSVSEESVARTLKILRGVGKKPVVISNPLPGFLINRLQIALLREALSLVQKGIVSVEDVDLAVRNSIGRRLSAAGVFEVCDISGLDIVQSTAANILESLEDTQRVSPLITEKVQQGHLGMKSGRGFYSWDRESAFTTRSRIAKALATIRGWE